MRIERLAVILKDARNKTISNKRKEHGFYVNIGMPLIFRDVDSKNQTHTFRSQPRFCRSLYKG